jgi:hypothetical protein
LSSEREILIYYDERDMLAKGGKDGAEVKNRFLVHKY